MTHDLYTRPHHGALGEGRHIVGESPVRCSTCEQFVTFHDEPATGIMLQTCGCGCVPVPRIYAPPAPKAKRHGLSAAKITVQCAWCETEFRTLARKPGRGCSAKCRHNLRRNKTNGTAHD